METFTQESTLYKVMDFITRRAYDKKGLETAEIQRNIKTPFHYSSSLPPEDITHLQ